MHADETLDASGLRCPLPFLKTKQALARLPSGAVLCVIATDPSSQRDFHSFVALSTHQLLKEEHTADVFMYWLKKGA